jgi:hypothetical protein
MADGKLSPANFRRRFVNDRFVDVIAVHPGRKFKAEYEKDIRGSLRDESNLSHYAIDSDYRRAETPKWVYELFGLKC